MARSPTLLWSRHTLSIDEFLEQYGNVLPALVKISEKNLDTGKSWRNINAVIRIKKCEKQPRILARNSENNVLSIPIDVPDKFQLIPTKGSKGHSKQYGHNPRLLTEIVGKEILPYTIRQSSPSTLRYHDGDEVVLGAKLGNLLVERIYAENFLFGNIIFNGHLFPTVMVIPALLELQVHVALGLENGGPREWQELQDTYRAVASGIVYNQLENLDVYIKPMVKEKMQRHRTCPASLSAPTELRPPLPPVRYTPNTGINQSTSNFKPSGGTFFLGTRQSVASIADVLLDDPDFGGESSDDPFDEKAGSLRYSEALKTESLRRDPSRPEEKPLMSVTPIVAAAPQPPQPSPDPQGPPVSRRPTAGRRRPATYIDLADVLEDSPALGPGPGPYPAPIVTSAINSLGDIPAELSGLSVVEVVECMRLLKLGHLAPLFRSQQVDGDILQTLTASTFKQEMGLTEIEAVKLHKFVHEGWRPKMTRRDSQRVMPTTTLQAKADTTRL